VIAEIPTGETLGAAWVRQVEGYGFVDHDTPELGIAVVAEARGSGVGAELLRALLDQVPRCSLSVDTRNPARRLYERMGFQLVRDDGHGSVVMVRGER
jgi:ribosomal protein S18 acetylase RimI-like enzyme